MNMPINAGVWSTIRKMTDETRTANATIADDSELVAPLTANTKYIIRGRIFYDTTALGDFKWRHNGAASPTLVRLKRNHVIAVDTAYSAADITMLGTGTNGGYIEFEAIIHNGANAGNFAFRWAQAVSDPGNTIVRAGSYLEWVAI